MSVMDTEFACGESDPVNRRHRSRARAHRRACERAKQQKKRKAARRRLHRSVNAGSLGPKERRSAPDEKVAAVATCVGAVGEDGTRAEIAAHIDPRRGRAGAAAAATALGLAVLPRTPTPRLAGDEARSCRSLGNDLAVHALQQPISMAPITPDQMSGVAAEHPNLVRVKESSGDVRRVTSAPLAGRPGSALLGARRHDRRGDRGGAGDGCAACPRRFPEEAVRRSNSPPTVQTEAAGDVMVVPARFASTRPSCGQLIKLAQEAGRPRPNGTWPARLRRGRGAAGGGGDDPPRSRREGRDSRRSR